MKHPTGMAKAALFFVILLLAAPLQAEPVLLKDLQGSGSTVILKEKPPGYSPPNPAGMGMHDPRSPGRDIQAPGTSSDKAVKLFVAMGDDDVEEAGRLIRQGGDPNAGVPGSDMRILMVARSAAMVKMLLEQGADPNLSDKDGAASLHYHATNPRALEIVPVLIRAGANVNARARGRGGRTPLHEARQWYFEGNDHTVGERLIRILVSSGADINATEHLGKTLLHTAVENNKPDLLILALELGADPNVRDEEGYSALDMARILNLTSLAEIMKKSAR